MRTPDKLEERENEVKITFTVIIKGKVLEFNVLNGTYSAKFFFFCAFILPFESQLLQRTTQKIYRTMSVGQMEPNCPCL